MFISHVSQLSVGQLVDAKIANIKNTCLVLQIGERVKAVCPAAHAFDSSGGLTATSNLTKRFKVGQMLRMRVWELDGGAVMLTNKKSLVDCDRSQCIMTIDDAVKGRRVVGVISKISELGLQIHFFNSIKALVPMAVLVKQGVTDPEESFRVGQIAKCVVLSVTFPNEYKGKKPRTAKPRITLSLDLGDSFLATLNEDDDTTTAPIKEMKSSSRSDFEFVSGTVIKNSDDGLLLRLDDGRSASLKSEHICDISKNSVVLCASYSVGCRIERALVIANVKNGIFVTVKPLLLSAATAVDNLLADSPAAECETPAVLPYQISDLSPGMVLSGFVHKVESYGILIRFRNNVSLVFRHLSTGIITYIILHTMLS